MESGNKFETYPGLNPERAVGAEEFESNQEAEKTEAELLLAAFESGSRFDDEDAKAREYNARLDKADELKDEINSLTEAIGAKSQQLMGLSLTPEQQRLLYEIEQLMAARKTARYGSERAVLDEQIARKTQEFSDLPVTPQQGGLLDEILQLMRERTVAEDTLAQTISL